MQISVLKLHDPVKIETNVNYLFVLDASGSMYSDIPRFKPVLKNKIATLVREGDTISIIVFSGRGESVILIEGFTVNSMADLSSLHSAIDRFYRPMGLTGFKEPLEQAKELAERLIQTNGLPITLCFNTDGNDNVWPEQDIRTASTALGQVISFGMVLELGQYCNTRRLSDIAEDLGAVHVKADKYASFEDSMLSFAKNRVASAKKKEVVLPGAELAYYLDEDRVISVKLVDGKGMVPEHIEHVYYLGNTEDTTEDKAYAAAIYLLSQKQRSNEVYSLLGKMGDVELINSYTNALGKQGLNRFQNLVLDKIRTNQFYLKGKDTTLVPKEDAYCVIDLIIDLIEDNAMWFPQHKAFNYTRIGSSRSQTALNKKEREELQNLSELLKLATDSSEIIDITAKMSTFIKKEYPFEIDYNSNGYPMVKLVWSSDRANLNLEVVYYGHVVIGKNDLGLPERFPSSIIRNYTFIKDGFVHVQRLPVRVSPELLAKFRHEGLDFELDGSIAILNLEAIPVINRKMVSYDNSAKEVFTLATDLMHKQALVKVFKEYEPKEATSDFSEYSTEANAYLASIGITSKGFSPSVTEIKTGDQYEATHFTFKIKGASSLPKTQDLLGKIVAGKKLNAGDIMIKQAIEKLMSVVGYTGDIVEFYNQPVTTSVKQELDSYQAEVRSIQNKLARTKFSMILGQTWFKEFDSDEEGTMDITYQGSTYIVTAEKKEKPVKI